MKFVFYNDTGRVVNVHPASITNGCISSKEPIKPLEKRVFKLPENTYPWVKLWDHSDYGLAIFVSPMKDKTEDQ